jgi:protein gp37
VSAIEWTQQTWNPTTGCDRVSPGCQHCYALVMANRLKAMGVGKYQRDGDPATSGPGFGITEHRDTLGAPLRWRTPRRVFVNSMSDLFHPGVSGEFIARVWAVMAATPQHTYQILTKRPARMRSLLTRERFRQDVIAQTPAGLDRDAVESAIRGCWPLRNVWLGVSVEDQKRAELRIPALTGTPAVVRFLSCEPLLGPLDLSRHLGVEYYDSFDDWGKELFAEFGGRIGGGLHWIIVGGESGPGARAMHLDWARTLLAQCHAGEIPVFVKQLGTVWASHGKGNNPHTWPADLRVRAYPAVKA